jgi:regulator of nucleoside diphosphate kinase
MKPIQLTDKDYKQLHQMVQVQHQHARPYEVDGLSSELKRARILPSRDIPADVITMNSIVQIKETKSAADMEITIVYPQDANLQKRWISVLAPVGTAILGCQVGDEVEWKVLDNILTYKVEKIIYQPEAAGDLIH